jgi:DNA-binding NtrC family response regulator
MPLHSTPGSAPRGSPYQPSAGPTTATPHFAGTSPALRAAITAAERFAPFDHATVLIEGESGTGKSYIARHLHLHSRRARGPYHQVILSTLDDNLAASDLFGHLSGSYTDARQSRPGHFVTANNGTLLLDEIGKASAAVQRKLLHAIEHQEVWPVGADRAVRLNVRLVAATNIALATLVERGSFLDDLAARLLTFRVHLPSLAERRADIPALVRQFVALRAEVCGYTLGAPRIEDDVMDALQHAAWPYNLRQLDGTIQRLLMQADGAPAITMAHHTAVIETGEPQAPRAVVLTPELVRERMRALSSVTATARSLGVSRWTIYRYLDRGDAAAAASPVAS